MSIDNYYPCPICDSTEISYGPPGATRGRYQIYAIYCEMCGTVFEVTNFNEEEEIRFAKLKVIRGLIQ